MNGGTIKNRSAKLGGAVYVSGGTDLFENFKNCVPGDVRTQEIAVRNTTNGMVRIYMKAEPVHPSDRDFLNQLHMTVHCEDQSIFDAAPSRRAQLTEYVLLGTFKGKGQTSLDVELTIPKELCMKKGKSKLTWIIWALVIALLAVVGVMAFKQWEYGQSADYYDSLRGGQQPFSWFISSACAEGTIVQDSEALHLLVESLFAAVTGTTEAEEIAARENMTEEQKLARNAQNASYRDVTLPWLKACFQPDEWEDVPRIAPEGSSLPVYSLEQSILPCSKTRWERPF